MSPPSEVAPSPSTVTGPEAYFSRDHVSGAELFVPSEHAQSTWTHAGAMVRGPAVSALLARAAGRTLHEEGIRGLRPARWTVDISRPVPMAPLSIRSRILRSGRRLALVEVDLLHDGSWRASARALFVAPGDAPAGERHETASAPPPPARVDLCPGNRLYRSAGRWSAAAADHHGTSLKEVWEVARPTVAGEGPSPFEVAAAIADLTSMVAHWGTTGVPFVNGDITLSLIRLPEGGEVGLVGRDRFESQGTAIGTALLYDRSGPCGVSSSVYIHTGGVSDPGARDHT